MVGGGSLCAMNDAVVEASSDPLRPIAQNIRRLRLGQGFSLSALARKAEISKSTLFSLEQGRGNPAIETLWALAQALSVPIGALFVDPKLAEIAVLRRDAAPVLLGRESGANGVEVKVMTTGVLEDLSFVPRHLLSSRSGGPFELYWIEMEAKTTRIVGKHATGVLEHVVPMSGRVRIVVDGHATVLEVGDRMSFPADKSHTYESLDVPATFLSVVDYP